MAILMQDNGDVSLSEIKQHSNKLKLSFFVADASHLCLSFVVNRKRTKRTGQCAIVWQLQEENKDTHCRVRTNEEAKEIVKNIIRTELNTISGREDFGCDIESLRHKPIWNEDAQKGLKEELSNRIDTFVEGAYVSEVKPDIGINLHRLPGFGITVVDANENTILKTALD